MIPMHIDLFSVAQKTPWIASVTLHLLILAMLISNLSFPGKQREQLQLLDVNSVVIDAFTVDASVYDKEIKR